MLTTFAGIDSFGSSTSRPDVCLPMAIRNGKILNFSYQQFQKQFVITIVSTNFDVLLIGHLCIFLFRSKFISCLYMFRAYVFIIRRSKLHHTASGIITLVGGRLMHSGAQDGHL